MMKAYRMSNKDENLKLRIMIRKAKRAVLKFLAENESCRRLELEKYVINKLNRKMLRDGRIIHRTKPIHSLAFILAYKELESSEEIKIDRRSGIPYPMTDFETLFSRAHKWGT